MKVGDNLEQIQYAKYFFDTNLPFADCDRLKTFIADQYGFDRAYINVLRSKAGHVCYPMFRDKSNNYIVFSVKEYIYSCINGELQLLNERR